MEGMINMQLTIIGPVLIALVFGLVVAAIAQLIAGPWNVREWARNAWVYFCFAYIILFGVIKV
jgi:hypothetical protein